MLKSTVFSKYASQVFLPRDSDLPSGVGSVVRLKRLPQGSCFIFSCWEAWRHGCICCILGGSLLLPTPSCCISSWDTMLVSASFFLPFSAIWSYSSALCWMGASSLLTWPWHLFTHLTPSILVASDHSMKWVPTVSVFLPFVLHVSVGRRSVILAWSV